MVSQTVLPFKVASTDETLTAQVGLVLFSEHCQTLGLSAPISTAAFGNNELAQVEWSKMLVGDDGENVSAGFKNSDQHIDNKVILVYF